MAKKNATKRLFRLKADRMLLGVCSGLGDYFNVDPTLIRLTWVFLSLVAGVIPGAVLYFLAAIIIPEEEETA